MVLELPESLVPSGQQQCQEEGGPKDLLGPNMFVMA